MILLDGKLIKEKKLDELKEKIDKLDRPLGLAVIQIGNDASSNIYVKNKEKTANFLGCNFNHIKLNENVNEYTILNEIDKLNVDNNIDGILIQMPIPSHLNKSKIQNRVLSCKDVDGLTDINSGLLVHNKDCLVPCTPLGILEILNYYNIVIKNKHVVIIGRSDLVGKPLASLMLNNDATVTVCHSKTNNLNDITITADILISAVGKKDLITKDMVKNGAIVIDVGINRVDNKIYGDVDFDNVSKKSSYITPVPGGIGQMTVLMLFMNLYKAYLNNAKNIKQ